MSVFNYKKYKVSLKYDSKKTQGLRTGDIVRRQYSDGKNVIYSLMCVLDYGTDKAVGDDNEIKEQPFFIAALLEGDAPQTEEILDFMRITNLFDLNRSGALYLTASDDQSPYMDVIDGIGRNKSVCWPESIAGTGNIDSMSQYIIQGKEYVFTEYIQSEYSHCRICRLIKNLISYSGFIGLQQDFYQYVENPQRVLISYKIKSSRKLQNINGSLEYSNGSRVDGEVTITSGTEWEYKFHTITVDWSGRHLRTFKLNLNDKLKNGDEVWVADFNIILLSSITGFQEASHIRIGKMDGVNDPVFGKLDGYGGYLQKLYASRSAHISGTLTAGDENGFAATFYAGKIHKNAFVNSLNVSFESDVSIDTAIKNPTGVGAVYVSSAQFTANAQTSGWLKSKTGNKYCFSFWLYAKNSCTFYVLQNGTTIGIISIDQFNTHQWNRHHAVFEINEAVIAADNLLLTLIPEFSTTISESDGNVQDENLFFFTAPQLEAGEHATQYQPTDGILNMVEDYGAWFSRGGIGGTIQNPLLQLNYNGEGSIGTRTGSFLLKVDGSGYLANKNIRWDDSGKVTFGKDVTLNWDNLGEDAQSEIASKSIKLAGGNSITVINNSMSGETAYSPSKIKLEISAEGFDLPESVISWFYLIRDGSYVKIHGHSGSSLTIEPTGGYWLEGDTCNIKCVALFNQNEYTDTILIQKNVTQGYEIIITSTNGDIFKNGDCETTLNASVYFQGVLVPEEQVTENFEFTWRRYTPDGMEITGWGQPIDIHQPVITLNYDLYNTEKISCEITSKSTSFILGQGILGRDTVEATKLVSFALGQGRLEKYTIETNEMVSFILGQETVGKNIKETNE
ncbi:MAG: hypothetical protein LBL79_02095 [Prevotella sp.]|jgi:hypothetical protein|nr:hypothetical protein [Prevotella sp.]